MKYKLITATSIGDLVQIGAGATILPGVAIGDNTLVGTVTKDTVGNCIVAGNRARVIREIAWRPGAHINVSAYRRSTRRMPYVMPASRRLASLFVT